MMLELFAAMVHAFGCLVVFVVYAFLALLIVIAIDAIFFIVKGWFRK